jgi:hypothetical protein
MYPDSGFGFRVGSMLNLPRIILGARGRVLLYALAFPGAVALDALTPLGIADWLIEVILVWIASVWGNIREMQIVATIASATMIVGLWSSPAMSVPFWIGALNRLVAIVVMWTMVHVAHRQRAAEQARRDTAAQVKILQGLLPICAACKAIKDERGRWHRLENYLSANSQAQLTHGLCPECYPKYAEELYIGPEA